MSDTTNNLISANNFIKAGYRLYQPQYPWGWPNTVINAMPLYMAARSKGMVVADGIHLNAAGQKYVASALLSSIN